MRPSNAWRQVSKTSPQARAACSKGYRLCLDAFMTALRAPTAQRGNYDGRARWGPAIPDRARAVRRLFFRAFVFFRGRANLCGGRRLADIRAHRQRARARPGRPRAISTGDVADIVRRTRRGPLRPQADHAMVAPGQGGSRPRAYARELARRVEPRMDLWRGGDDRRGDGV